MELTLSIAALLVVALIGKSLINNAGKPVNLKVCPKCGRKLAKRIERGDMGETKIVWYCLKCDK